MTKTNGKIEICKFVRSFFVLQINNAQDFVMITKIAQNIWRKPTWEMLYICLDHLSIDGIQKLSKIATGLEILFKSELIFYESYIFVKQIRYILYQLSKWEIQALARVYTNLIGPITPTGYNGFRYYLLLTDDTT